MCVFRLLCLAMLLTRAVSASGETDRAFTVAALVKIARPVLTSAATSTLAKDLPPNRRAWSAPLEAYGRTLCGIAPWLSLGPDDTPEGKLRAEFITLARKGLVACTKKDGPGRLIFGKPSQPLVDTAFLSQALLEAPDQLWHPLSETEKADIIAALKETRAIKPYNNNWLLFSALVETAIWKFTGEPNLRPIQTAIETHQKWYLGDGTYGDGPKLHWDYYNSFVIQPALLTIMDVCVEKKHPLADLAPTILKRAKRYAEIQERMISPEGTYPVIGRSSCYRFGAFQHLSLMTFRKQLPAALSPAGTRCALTAVIRRTLEKPTFDENGWLLPGAVGHQPAMRDSYINTGSLYLCLCGMKHLGLPANDPFWTAPDAPWTQQRIWNGEPSKGDHSVD